MKMCTEEVKLAEQLTGHTNLMDAFNFLESERTAMIELHTRNNAQAAYIKSWEKLLALGLRITHMINAEGNLFISAKLRTLIDQFNQQQSEMTEDLKEALKL